MKNLNLQNTLTIAERLTGPTPKFFQIIQIIGAVLAGLSGTILGIEAKGIDLPSWVDVIGNAATLVGGIVATLLGQFTVDVEAFKQKNALK